MHLVREGEGAQPRRKLHGRGPLGTFLHQQMGVEPIGSLSVSTQHVVIEALCAR